MVRVIVFILAMAGLVTPVSAQSADKALIAQTRESISARRFRLETPAAEESYRILMQSLSTTAPSPQRTCWNSSSKSEKSRTLRKKLRPAIWSTSGFYAKRRKILTSSPKPQ